VIGDRFLLLIVIAVLCGECDWLPGLAYFGRLVFRGPSLQQSIAAKLLFDYHELAEAHSSLSKVCLINDDLHYTSLCVQR
jgi:hypothetical protein